ncbi:thiol:disulfide interchange protein DsbA/DsbL [Shewanella sp. SP1S2-4]|uniref:Thiol:disulfide interchange protein n=1 Tax=Shewanella vaxholmensis TaxID=3063535 RepID=A0ABU9UQC0_9GAMM|nr:MULTISPECIES: thiol:disulfide interchange protein DsbA/DsbL [unclassified Shewanella]MDT3306697.1 thiol:disulfide interchange protein DsbA/DsbL [Shewanella sp. SP1S1-4]MDT3319598.1 thiol:disulfide interchange protein DsbA/DsbL [Shewanella sp. SP1S2-4]
MLKKSLVVLGAMLLSCSVSAAKFSEGEHYQLLGDASFNAPNQVVKVYSVNCPFCYKYDKSVTPGMVNNLPKGVTFDAYHITTKPPFGAEKALVLAYAKTQSEEAYKAAKMAFYKHYHDDKIHFTTADEAIDFGLKAANLDKAAFDTAKNSPEVKALLTKWDQGVAVAKIQGIPAIVVNGKYLINTKSIRSMQMLDELVAELVAK